VAFSPQGNLLAAGVGSQVRLWRTNTWDSVRQLALGGLVHALSFSRDGTRLASVSDPGEATVWDVGSWTVVRRISGVGLYGVHEGRLDWSPDGKVLVIGDAAHRLQAVDLATGDRIFDIPEAHPEPITAVAWSPNGSLIASGSGFTGGAIRLWDATTGNRLGELPGHTSWICQLVFSTDGRRLYSASADQTIRIWDVEQGRCLATLRGSRDEVYGLALSPDGTTLASACKDGVVSFWDARPRREEQQPRLIPLGELAGRALGGLAGPAFAPDSRILAMPISGTVRLFDLTAAKEMEQLPALGTDVQMVFYSPDGTLLVSGGTGGKIRVWSCTEHRLVRELGDPNAPIYPFGFRADGRRFLSADPQGKVVWWDTHTWQPAQTYVVKLESPPTAAAVSPDGRLLAAGTATGSVYWLDAETGQLLATRTEAHQHPVAGVAFSTDSTRAASVSEDGTLAIWDTSSRQLLTSPFKSHMLGAHGVAFSADGRRLATGSNGREAVKLWDMSTYREVVALSGEGSLFWFVAFSPDGQWLATCNWEGQLHLWRAPSWAEIEAVESKQSGQSP
jgi:WD40 repeat protein